MAKWNNLYNYYEYVVCSYEVDESIWLPSESTDQLLFALLHVCIVKVFPEKECWSVSASNNNSIKCLTCKRITSITKVKGWHFIFNWITNVLNSITKAPGGGGALPYVGGYQVPVNRPPFFTPILHPMTPFFYSVHTQWPLFSTFVPHFTWKLQIFCALRAHFVKFNDFVAISTENLQILPWNCIFAHWMTHIFGSPHQKSPHFFGAHTEWPPFFDDILHRMPPIFVLQ